MLLVDVYLASSQFKHDEHTFYGDFDARYRVYTTPKSRTGDVISIIVLFR